MIAHWDFDFDFGANYHVELDAGVVKNSDGKTNAALTDASKLAFKTVLPGGADGVESSAVSGAASKIVELHSNLTQDLHRILTHSVLAFKALA